MRSWLSQCNLMQSLQREYTFQSLTQMSLLSLLSGRRMKGLSSHLNLNCSCFQNPKSSKHWQRCACRASGSEPLQRCLHPQSVSRMDSRQGTGKSENEHHDCPGINPCSLRKSVPRTAHFRYWLRIQLLVMLLQTLIAFWKLTLQ